MRDVPSTPLVRLEVDYMKHSILHAFSEHQMKLDKDVKRAVERFCAPGNVTAIVNAEVERSLKSAIETEIHDFFAYGAGRHFIAAQVRKKLEETHQLLSPERSNRHEER